MLTIFDLGHKPRCSCYLIELELYPHSDHKPIVIMVDAPIEISDILDFIPSARQNKGNYNWRLDESGKQWIIGNKRFKDSPFYFTVPFKKEMKPNSKHDRIHRKCKNTKKRKGMNDEHNDEKTPFILSQKRVLIDIILISNHESILGLPQLFKNRRENDSLLQSLLSTNATKMVDIDAYDTVVNEGNEGDEENDINICMAPHCKIYATEPTKQYGKLLMKSLSSSNHCSTHYFVTNEGCARDDYYYEMDLICECIDGIRSVEYNETISVLSGGELSIMCISSGLYIGSSNWIICGAAMDLSIGIVMGSCGATNRHPQSITLSPHFDVVGNIDLVLIDDLQSIVLKDESANDSLQSMEKKIIETISNNKKAKTKRNKGSSKTKGTVIIPSSCCGIAYDILERIHSMLNKYDYTHVQIYFISSIASESISYSSIFGEYLHENNLRHLSDAKYPFGFQTYIAHNRLIHCMDWNNEFCFKYIKSNLSESRIIICESPSLRYGNIVHLLSIFNHPNNTLILTDPRFIPHLALHPFNHNNTLKLQIASYPIDARLQIKELCVLLRKVCPQYAFIPNNYYNRIKQNMNKFIDINTLQLQHQQQQQQHHNAISPVLLQKIKNIKYFTMSTGVYHSVALNKPSNKTLYIDSLIAQHIYPKNINPNHSNNMFIASLSGTIDYRTNKHQLVLRNQDFVNQKCIIHRTFIGTMNMNAFLNNLRIQQTYLGATNIRQKKTNMISFTINRDKKVEILISDNMTNIRCSSALNKEKLINILDLVSQQMRYF